jgi:hypothetical protein
MQTASASSVSGRPTNNILYVYIYMLRGNGHKLKSGALIQRKELFSAAGSHCKKKDREQEVADF